MLIALYSSVDKLYRSSWRSINIANNVNDEKMTAFSDYRTTQSQQSSTQRDNYCYFLVRVLGAHYDVYMVSGCIIVFSRWKSYTELRSDCKTPRSHVGIA